MKRFFGAALGVTFGAAAAFAPTAGHAVATYDAYSYGVLELASVSGEGTVDALYTVDGDTADTTGVATASTGTGGYIDGTGPFSIPDGPDPVTTFAGTEAFVMGSATDGTSDSEVLTTTSLTLTNTGSAAFIVTFNLFATFEITTTADPGDSVQAGGALAVVDMDLASNDPGYFLYDDFRLSVDNDAPVFDFPEEVPLVTIVVDQGASRTIGFFVDSFAGASATADVPLPAALPLLGLGIAALGFVARRRRDDA